MGWSEQVFFGAVLVGAGIVGLVIMIVKRVWRAVPGFLAFSALGVGLLPKLLTVNTALGAMWVIVGMGMLAFGSKPRPVKTVLTAILFAAGGAGVLAGWYTAAHAFSAYLAAYGCWSLSLAIRAKQTNSILFYGGMAGMGVGYLGIDYSLWFILPASLGSIICLVGAVRNGSMLFPTSDTEPSTKDTSHDREIDAKT